MGGVDGGGRGWGHTWQELMEEEGGGDMCGRIHPHCPVLAESSWSNPLPTLSAIPSVYCITVALLAVQIC